MTYREVYGPRDTSVLCRQAGHRSEHIITGAVGEEDLLQPYYTGNAIFWSFRVDTDRRTLHPRVLDVLDQMGLLRVARCGTHKIDHHLITALVERWRGETHTFHFPFGEATVTLQDVGVLWGLRIDGEPVIVGDTYKTTQQWSDLLHELIGFRPADDDIKGQTQLKLKPLTRHLKDINITNNTPPEEVRQYARGCALLMIGAFMMPNSSRSRVSLLYLPCLRDINVIGGYSWGSAVLSCLYRELCTCAENPAHPSIGGALSLLQIWAWSRIPPIKPSNVGPYLHCGELRGENDRVLANAPIGVRWMQFHDHTSTVSHNLREYRDCFDRLRESDFIWMPYDFRDADIGQLGPTILTPYVMAYCPLICMWMVELHHPGRVLRQFGAVQGIPMPLHNAHQQEHGYTLTGNYFVNWQTYHQHWIGYWRTKIQISNVQWMTPGHPNTYPDYKKWYRSITRLLISPARYREMGFQPASVDARVHHLDDLMTRLVVNATDATVEEPETVEELRKTSFEIAQAWKFAQRMQSTGGDEHVPQSGGGPGTTTGGHFDAGTSRGRRSSAVPTDAATSRGGHPMAGTTTGIHFDAGTSRGRRSTAEHATGRDFNAGPSTSRHSVSGSSSSTRRRNRVERRDGDLLASSQLPGQTSVPAQPEPAYMGTWFQQPFASMSPYTPLDQTFTSLLQSGMPPLEYSGGGNLMSTFGGPQYASSPVAYPAYESGPSTIAVPDMNVSIEAREETVDVEQQPIEENARPRKSTRTRRAPDCGTKGQKGWFQRLLH